MIRQKIKRKYNFLKLHTLLVMISVFFLVSFSVIEANSDINLSVAPNIFELHLEKGEVYNGKVKIYNKGETAMPFEAIASNFDAEEFSGTAKFYDNNFDINNNNKNEEDDILFNPRKWMKISNPNFILDAKETVNVKFSISVPQNAENGGYYTVIFFEPKISTSGNINEEKSNVSIVPKIGIPFLISVGEREKPADASLLTISEFNIPEKFRLKRLEASVINLTGLFSTAYAETIKSFSVVETGQLQFNLKIKNNDTYHTKPYGKLAILSDDNRVMGETEIKKITILPKKTRDIPIDFNPPIPAIIKKLPAPLSDFISKNLFFGKFHAVLSLNTEDTATTEKIEFWIFPWKIFLIIVFILTIIILFRKRIRLAGRALLKKKQAKF